MTAQICDSVLFDGGEYSLIGIRGWGLASPEQFGMEAKMLHTACYRGFFATYELTKEALYLRELTLREINGNYLPVDGIQSEMEQYQATYRNLTVVVPFTGKIRLAKGFTDDLYVHMGLRLQRAASPHLKAIITVAMNTGMRKGEIRLLRWTHIDQEKKIIHLPSSVTKEGKPKDIPINENVWQVLQGVKPKLRVVGKGYHDFVFTFLGKPIGHKDSLKKAFTKACERAKIPYGTKDPSGLIFHDLRRSVKTYMLEAGVDKVYRDTLLGHSLQGMDAHYLVPSKIQEAMAEYTTWLNTQIQNVDQSVDQEPKMKKHYRRRAHK